MSESVVTKRLRDGISGVTVLTVDLLMGNGKGFKVQVRLFFPAITFTLAGVFAFVAVLMVR